MYTYYVKWCYTDDYGNPGSREIKWFVNENDASIWKSKMRAGNGSYFLVLSEKHGDYSLYKQMLSAQKEYYRLIEEVFGEEGLY